MLLHFSTGILSSKLKLPRALRLHSISLLLWEFAACHGCKENYWNIFWPFGGNKTASLFIFAMEKITNNIFDTNSVLIYLGTERMRIYSVPPIVWSSYKKTCRSCFVTTVLTVASIAVYGLMRLKNGYFTRCSGKIRIWTYQIGDHVLEKNIQSPRIFKNAFCISCKKINITAYVLLLIP